MEGHILINPYFDRDKAFHVSSKVIQTLLMLFLLICVYIQIVNGFPLHCVVHVNRF